MWEEEEETGRWVLEALLARRRFERQKKTLFELDGLPSQIKKLSALSITAGIFKQAGDGCVQGSGGIIAIEVSNERERTHRKWISGIIAIEVSNEREKTHRRLRGNEDSDEKVQWASGSRRERAGS